MSCLDSRASRFVLTVALPAFLSSLAPWLSTEPLSAQQWRHYGGDEGGQQYSALNSIDRGTIESLVPAWTFHTGHLAEPVRERSKLTFETTPILVDGHLVLETPFNVVIALDPGTGREIWRFDPKLNREAHYSEVKARGVAAWTDGRASSGACATRIVFGTLDARLMAIDSRTGVPCQDFGVDGIVDLTHRVELKGRADYQVTSPPAVFEDLVVVGSSIGDNRRVDVERGVVRAFDARTGAERWSFDPIPRSEDSVAAKTWLAGRQKTGGANAWSVLSVDSKRGLVFAPTGSAAPDFYGGERPGVNLYANSVVALEARTGSVRWHFQTVHHDLWDYDVPAQPTLATQHRDGRDRDLIIQGTKMGFLFVLDRDTGEAVFPVEERPVPRSDVPGEWTAPTQPFPTLPAPLTPVSHDSAEAWGASLRDLEECRELLSGLRYDGAFTPPSLEGTLVFPGNGGGMNWGGVAVDETSGIAVAASNRLPTVVRLHERLDYRAAVRQGGVEYANQQGTPFGMSRFTPRASSGFPCTPPPWGVLTAVDLNTGEHLWQVPLGTVSIGGHSFEGAPTIGGPMILGSGIVFIGATADGVFRAFDLRTGERLWQAELPSGGNATPMSYEWQGRQHIVIAAGGYGALEGMGKPLSDAVVAFALEGSPAREEAPSTKGVDLGVRAHQKVIVRQHR